MRSTWKDLQLREFLSKYYRYSQNNNFLTDAQRQFYEENGYIIIRKLVDHGLLEQCRKRFVDICDGKIESGNMVMMKDAHLNKTGAMGEHLIITLQDFLFDDVLYEFARHRAIVDVLSSIIGDEITAVNSMLINKPPGSICEASKQPLHQDLHYFPFRPADKICAVFTAMERIDTINGCLFVIPGTHKGPLYPHAGAQGVSPYHAAHSFENLPRVNLLLEKGDTIFFHPTLLHGAGPNCSKGFRKSIVVQYVNSNCHFFDVRETSQQSIAEEVIRVNKRRGFDVDFKAYYLYKSRRIAGKPGTLQNFSRL